MLVAKSEQRDGNIWYGYRDAKYVILRDAGLDIYIYTRLGYAEASEVRQKRRGAW